MLRRCSSAVQLLSFSSFVRVFLAAVLISSGTAGDFQHAQRSQQVLSALDRANCLTAASGSSLSLIELLF